MQLRSVCKWYKTAVTNKWTNAPVLHNKLYHHSYMAHENDCLHLSFCLSTHSVHKTKSSDWKTYFVKLNQFCMWDLTNNSDESFKLTFGFHTGKPNIFSSGIGFNITGVGHFLINSDKTNKNWPPVPQSTNIHTTDFINFIYEKTWASSWANKCKNGLPLWEYKEESMN